MSLQPLAPRSQFEQPPFRRALVEWLREIQVGEIATYEDLSELAGQDVREQRGSLYGAFRELEPEGIVFDVVLKIGYKRVDDPSKVAKAKGYLTKGNRAAIRTIRVLRATDREALSPEDKVQYDKTELQAGAVRMFNSKSFGRKIEASLIAGVATMKALRASVQDTLKQFGG